MRIDKWLWVARFFKTRALAAKACDLGRIEANGLTSKASRDVKTGDMLRVKNEGGEFTVQVLGVSELRGPAAAAQALYQETELSRETRIRLAEERKLLLQFEGGRESKPSKRDRRDIDRMRRRS